MPSSELRHLGNQPGQPIMQPAFPPSYRPDDVLISPLSLNALGTHLSAENATLASQTYPSANQARAYMFCLADYFLVRKVWWMNGTTATTDSADVGVYTEAGSRLVSGGGTAIATASVVQEVDVTDTLLAPGRYWCAYAQNGVTATPTGLAPANVPLRCMGVAQMATAYVLPATFTPAAVSGTGVLPFFGIASRTQVA